MAKLFLVPFTIILLFSSTIKAQTPAVLLMDGSDLVAVKKKISSDKKLQLLLSDLEKDTDKLLTMKPISVMEKSFTPASGDKHDYMSQAPYFWYDSSKPKGLPYMRRDGERNPEIEKITDRKNLGDLDNATRTLALTYYLTGNEKYAKKAAELLQTWFFDEATKMNPNLDFGQGIPGVNTGRGIGIIETIALTGIADAAGLLQGSKFWTNEKDKNLKQWYNKYLLWLMTSKNGKEEHASKNNHGTYYDMQVVDFALFSGNKSIALQTLKESKERMELQIDKEGKLPLELERTNSLWYSTYNLEAWFKLAKLAQVAGVDLWHYTTKQNASIQKAFDWLTPYAIGEKAWTYQQIGEYNKDNFYVLLLQAAKYFKDDKYISLANKIKPARTNPIVEIELRKF